MMCQSYSLSLILPHRFWGAQIEGGRIILSFVEKVGIKRYQIDLNPRSVLFWPDGNTPQPTSSAVLTVAPESNLNHILVVETFKDPKVNWRLVCELVGRRSWLLKADISKLWSKINTTSIISFPSFHGLRDKLLSYDTLIVLLPESLHLMYYKDF